MKFLLKTNSNSNLLYKFLAISLILHILLVATSLLLFYYPKKALTITPLKKGSITLVSSSQNQTFISSNNHVSHGEKKPSNSDRNRSENEIKVSDSTLSSKDLYIEQIRSLIEQQKYFPSQAEKLQIDGEVIISFDVFQNGEIVDIKIVKKSTFDPFNVAAKECVSKIKKFPKFPKDMTEEKISIQQKLIFKVL